MTDHRINLTLYKLDFIMDGDLDGTDQCAGRRTPGRAAGGLGGQHVKMREPAPAIPTRKAAFARDAIQ